MAARDAAVVVAGRSTRVSGGDVGAGSVAIGDDTDGGIGAVDGVLAGDEPAPAQPAANRQVPTAIQLNPLGASIVRVVITLHLVSGWQVATVGPAGAIDVRLRNDRGQPGGRTDGDDRPPPYAAAAATVPHRVGTRGDRTGSVTADAVDPSVDG